jgi:hypothetical protein
MKWEYLRVGVSYESLGVSGHTVGVPSFICVIANDGTFHEWKKQPGDRDILPVMGRLLTKLGDDGWELAGVTQPLEGAAHTLLFFKRPKP